MPEHPIESDLHRQIACAARATGSDAQNTELTGRRRKLSAGGESFKQGNCRGLWIDVGGNRKFSRTDISPVNQLDDSHPDFFDALLDSTPSCFSLRYK